MLPAPREAQQGSTGGSGGDDGLRRLLNGRSPYYMAFAAFAIVSVGALLSVNQNQGMQEVLSNSGDDDPPCYLAFVAFAIVSISALLSANQSQGMTISIANSWDLLAGSLKNASDSSPSPAPTTIPLDEDGATGPGSDLSTSDGSIVDLNLSGAPTPVSTSVPTLVPTFVPTSPPSAKPDATPTKGVASSEYMHRPEETGAPGDCTILILYNGAFPPFLIHTLSQIRCWNPASDCDLWLVGNQSAIDKFLSEDLKDKKDEFQLKIGILEDLEMTEDYWYFAANTPLIKQGAFWVRATTRCFFIEAAMRKYDLTDVTYFETDIMVYFSVRNFMPLFRSLVKHFAVTPTSKGQFTLGVTFIRKPEDMREFNHFQRTNYTTARGGWEPAEMEQMVDFKRQMGDEYLYTFPTLPYLTEDDKANKMAFDTESVFPPSIVFDAASWGQYYGGTPNGASPGYTGKRHYVGPQLRLGCCSMRWEQEEGTGRWFPVVDWKNPKSDSDAGVSKIMDLHIHSKQAKYMMNSCSEEGTPLDFVPLPAEE